MKYVIDEVIFSLANNFKIRDIDYNARYIVESKLFSIGRKIYFKDLDRQDLLYIEQNLFSVFGEYNIFKNKSLIMNIKLKPYVLFPRFSIKSELGDFEIDGSIMKYNFSIYRDKKLVASVEKALISFSDSYTVNIEDGEDHPLILSLVIILDQIFHDNK